MTKLIDMSPAELKEHEARIDFNRKFAGFKRTVKAKLEAGDLRPVQLQLEFIKNNPSCLLPKKYLNHAQTIQAIEEAIKEYLNGGG